MSPCLSLDLSLFLILDRCHDHYQDQDHHHHHSLKGSTLTLAPICVDRLAEIPGVESNKGAFGTALVKGDTTSSITHGAGEVMSLPRPDSNGRHHRAQDNPGHLQFARHSTC